MTDLKRGVAMCCGAAYRQALEQANFDASAVDLDQVAFAAERLMDAEEVQVFQAMANDRADMGQVREFMVDCGARPRTVPGLKLQ
jgi:hypothetical protein